MRRKRGVVRQSLISSIKPLGLFEDGSPFYSIQGREDDPEKDENGGGEDDEEEEEDPEGEKPKEEKPPKLKRRAPANETDTQKIKRLNAENKERREAAEALEAQLRERSDKDKSDLEVATRDAKDFKAKYEKVSEDLLAAKVENAFLKFTDGKKKYEWQDPDLVLDILNSKYELEIGDDGSVEGLAAAIKELAKDKPFLLVNANDDDGDGADKKPPVRKGASGGASGARKSEGKETATRNKLLVDYPVLNQGVPVQ